MRVCLLFFALVSAAVLALSPAAAQCRLCDAPTTAADITPTTDSIALELETALDFDGLVFAGPGEGTATLRPDGSRSVSGTVGAISGRAMVGTVRVRGEAGRSLRVLLPGRIDLYSIGGGKVTIEEISSDLPSLPRLDGAGNLEFRFGGRLRISGDAEGDYRGDVPITVEYL